MDDKHLAKAPFLGYAYQLMYALFLLLDADEEDCSISIENFDDIVFDKNGSPRELIQTKHHIGRKTNLSDYGEDLWKTLKSWLDAVKDNEDILTNNYFALVTTSKAPKDSVAHILKKLRNDSKRDVNHCYSVLKSIAESSKNKALSHCYDTFLSMDEDIVKKLLNRITVIDGEPIITELDEKIKKKIRFAIVPEYEDLIYENVLGAWFKKCIKILSISEISFVSQAEIRNTIFDFSSRYRLDDLPIDVDGSQIDGLITESNGKEMFCRQLDLINVQRHRMATAISDYYKAQTQRSKWLSNGLLLPDELEKYESRLIDEWTRQYSDMVEDLGDNPSTMDKVNAGKKLFRAIDSQQINIRKYCDQPFIMRGSYHMLSNSLRVGWHPDYHALLNDDEDSNDD